MGNLSRAIVSMFRIACGDTWIGEGAEEDGVPILNPDGKYR